MCGLYRMNGSVCDVYMMLVGVFEGYKRSVCEVYWRSGGECGVHRRVFVCAKFTVYTVGVFEVYMC